MFWLFVPCSQSLFCMHPTAFLTPLFSSSPHPSLLRIHRSSFANLCNCLAIFSLALFTSWISCAFWIASASNLSASCLQKSISSCASSNTCGSSFTSSLLAVILSTKYLTCVAMIVAKLKAPITAKHEIVTTTLVQVLSPASSPSTLLLVAPRIRAIAITAATFAFVPKLFATFVVALRASSFAAISSYSLRPTFSSSPLIILMMYFKPFILVFYKNLMLRNVAWRKQTIKSKTLTMRRVAADRRTAFSF